MTQSGNDLIYTPQTGFTGTDVFTYTICDNDGCDDATVTVTVTDDGQTPPIAVNDNATTTENMPVTISATSNDIATDGDVFSISSFTQPQSGAVTQVGNNFIYTPDADFTGTDVFTYTICDDDGCDQATVTVVVTDNGMESPPIANNNNVTTSINTPVTVDATANDVETDGDAFSIESFTQGQNGTVTQVGNNFIYTPNTGFVGNDFFTYTICDNDGCDQASVFVNVNDGGQSPPIAVNDNTTTAENTPVTIPATVNDVATDGDLFSIESFTQPNNGTVTQVGSNFVYTPDNGFTGTDVFTYTICDNDGCDEATVTVNVTDDGQIPPIAVNDNATTTENTAVTIDATANDIETNGDLFSIESFTQPMNGTVTQTGDNFIYTPDLGFTGTDEFTYTICDDDGCDQALVTVFVQDGGTTQSPPIAVDDNATTDEETPITIDVTNNDQATDGDDFTIEDFTQPPNGSVTLIGDDFVYTPDDDFTGTDSFTYTVCDNDGCDEATVTIVVEEDNTVQSPPIANNDYVGVEINNPTPIYVTINDVETDGDDFFIDDFTQPDNGSVTLNGDVLTYTPDTDFVGNDTLTYTLCDNDGCDQATVYIFIEGETGTETPPIAIDDYTTTSVNTPITIDVTANDQATDGDSFSITTFTPPTNGTAILVGGNFIYTPNTDFIGSDSFTYTICDDDGCDQATVYVFIQDGCNNQTEYCIPLFEISSVHTEICVAFCDVPDATLVTVDPLLFECSIEINDDNCFGYLPLPGTPSGQVDTLMVIGCNTAGQCDTIYINIYVGNCTPESLPPVAVDDFATTTSEHACYH